MNKLIKVKPVITHINFVNSYLIKTKKELIIKEVIYEDTKVTIQTDSGNFELLDFPLNHKVFIGTERMDNDSSILVLAIPKILSNWGSNK